MASKMDTLIQRRKTINELIVSRTRQVDHYCTEIAALVKEGQEIDRLVHDALSGFIAVSEKLTIGADSASDPDVKRITRPIIALRVPHHAPTLEDHIASVLQDAQRPMLPKEITNVILKRGLHISGKKPANNVAAHLSYSKRFAKTANGTGWVLREPELVPDKTNAPTDLVR